MNHSAVNELTGDAAIGLERAAFRLGQVGAALEDPASAICGALSRRQVARAMGGRETAIRSLLLAGESVAADPVGRFHKALITEPDGAKETAKDLLAVLESAGLHGAVRTTTAGALHEAMTSERRQPVLMRAATVAGTLAAGAPGSHEVVAAATICAERILMAGGLTRSPWAAPTQLDAATRASAVQLERTGDWSEWTRAWCTLVAREASATEKALRAATERMVREAEAAKAQHRVGATDAVVLARLHTQPAFTIREAAGALGLSAPTVGTAIERLEGMGFAQELTGQSRDRIWTSTALLELSLTP
jgi:hypothetical protein